MDIYEDLSKSELIALLNEEQLKKLSKKATFKELLTGKIIKQDTLFIVPNGFIIGKPFVEDDSFPSPYILLTDVILLSSLTPPVNKSYFNNMNFQLAIDQIIAFSPIDRDFFLSQLESHLGN